MRGRRRRCVAAMRDSTRANQPDQTTGNIGPFVGLSHFGIKAKLSLTIACLAALTAIASSIAWLVFEDIDRSVTRVTENSLPSVINALSLAEKSNEIAIAVPKLITSRTQEERVREETLLRQRSEELEELISELGATLISAEDVTALLERQAELSLTISQMNNLIRKRIDLALRREARSRELSVSHTEFLEAIEPLVDDAFFDLVMSGERTSIDTANALTDIVERGVSNLDLLLTLNAEINLTAGILSEALHLDERLLVQPLMERFEAAAAAAERSLRRLPEELREPFLAPVVEQLLELGREPSNALGLPFSDTATDALALKARGAAIQGLHEQVLLILTPMIDDAAFELVISTEGITESHERALTDLIDVGAHLLHLFLSVRSEANLVAGLLSLAAVTPDKNALQPLEERVIAAEGQILRMLGEILPELDAAEMEAPLILLLETGKGSDGIFALRRNELERLSSAEALLQESLVLTNRLNEEVEVLAESAQKNSRDAAVRSAEAISSGKTWMIILAAGAIAGAGLVTIFYVGPRLIRPIEEITGAMADLAEGDTSVEIPGRERGDELGRMAQALGIFRDTAIEVQVSNLRELEETRRRLSDAIESISEAFSLYDNQDRLVVCNSKYRSLLYPEIAENIVPGMTFEEIVRLPGWNGTYTPLALISNKEETAAGFWLVNAKQRRVARLLSIPT